MTRAERYTPAQVAAAIVECKGMVTMAARRLGCNRMTVARYAKKYASVREALTDAREEMGDVAELALYRSIQEGEGWAIAFYLSTQCKSRGYVKRQEITGEDGGPIKSEVKHIGDLSDDDLLRIASRGSSRAAEA